MGRVVAKCLKLLLAACKDKGGADVEDVELA
jgi:hypothetical protein